MYRNEIRYKRLRRNKKEMAHTEKRCSDKKNTESLRGITHSNKIRHKGLSRKKTEMACIEKRCFDKKIEKVRGLS
jgi:hypothetical protein